MLSLGTLHQQKKISLQAQEAEAHSLFLRVIDLIRSNRLVDQVEAIALCGSCCSRFQSPVIVNSAFMRMAEAFRNGPSMLRMEILRVIQRSAEHLPKIRNYTDFVRPISEVIYSNDPDARAVTLRLLAAIAVSIPNQLDAHHAVRMALQSNDSTELQAALYACLNIVRVTGKFAEEVTHDVVTLIGRPGLSDDIRIAAIQILPYLSGSPMDTMMIADRLTTIIDAYKTDCGKSFRLVQTCLRVQSDLLARLAEPELILRHCVTLAGYIQHPWPEVYKPARQELLRFFRLCMSQLSPKVLISLLVDLVPSDRPRVSKQGIKCAFVVAYDPVTWDVLESSDDRLVYQLRQHATEFLDASGACAFSVLCRMVALGNGVVKPEAFERTTDAVGVLYSHLIAIVSTTEDSAMLSFVLKGLSPVNLDKFPSSLFHHISSTIENFMKFRNPRCSLMCLKYLYQLSFNYHDLVRKVYDQCFTQFNFPDLEENEKFQMVFHMVALRFAVTVDPDERAMARDVIATGLSLFSLYRLARTALTDGRTVFAMEVLEHLVKSPELENMATVSNWSKVLLGLSQSESLKSQLLSNITAERQNQVTKERIDLLTRVQTRLTEVSTLSGNDKFRKAYLELTVQTQRCLLSLVDAIEELCLRASVSSNPDSVLSSLSTSFLGCIESFTSGANQSAQLFRASFDADGPSLGIVRYHFAVCTGFGEVLSAVTKRPFLVYEGIQSSESVCVRGAEDKLATLATLRTKKFDTAEEFYHWLKELYQLCSFFLSKIIPLPRYFLQKFQQTVMSVSLTPTQPADKDFAQILNMDTKLALKVDGAINTDKRLERPFIRQVSKVQIKLRITLEKSLPFSSKALHGVETAQETMMQDVMLEERSFFSHTFVMFLGYPGLYKIHVDFELHDQNLVAWDPGQSFDLMVKVVEGRKD
ncbi:hypothetical protein RvY_09031 [Ramazzottius varieornatus]|uniref:Integrator complex subunit 7 n=1 Tax=Ramazzottius varieornatus TaxID=947166 RepID=A0A1D1VDI6_RAMVA|nr:hypothetical protein RvY_09031 [Ramazzottius varieornatus]